MVQSSPTTSHIPHIAYPIHTPPNLSVPLCNCANVHTPPCLCKYHCTPYHCAIVHTMLASSPSHLPASSSATSYEPLMLYTTSHVCLWCCMLPLICLSSGCCMPATLSHLPAASPPAIMLCSLCHVSHLHQCNQCLQSSSSMPQWN